MRRLGIVVACAGLLLVTMGQSAAEARLDRGFGEGGVVRVQPPLLPPWQYQVIRGMAARRDGNIYVHATQSYCGAECSISDKVLHYLPNGKLDTSFGSSGSYLLPPEGEGLSTLAVDSAGRPLIAEASVSAVVVRRLTASGIPDAGFGSAGAVSIACACQYIQPRLIPGPAGTLTAVVPRSGSSEVIRLEADGSVAKSFGRDGGLTIKMDRTNILAASSPGQKGPIYLAEDICCSSWAGARLVRFSDRGRIDGRFTKFASRALRHISRPGSFGTDVTAVVARTRGMVDVFGVRDFSKGFQLRLGSDGKPLRWFGRHGLRVLPLPVASAALGSDGAVVAVSGDNLHGVGVVFRVLHGGRLDRSFGLERVPGSVGNSGMSIVAQAGRRALVLDLGLRECRGYCQVAPQLVRFLEGPKRR